MDKLKDIDQWAHRIYFGISYAWCALNIRRSPPRRLLVFRCGLFFKVLKRATPFSLDRKEAKDQVGKKASLPHKAFALQTRQNHGLESFAPLRSLIGPRFCKISYALAVTQGHHRSARFRPKLFCRRGTAKLPLLLFPLQGVRGSALGIGADTGPVDKACAVWAHSPAEGNAQMINTRPSVSTVDTLRQNGQKPINQWTIELMNTWIFIRNQKIT